MSTDQPFREDEERYFLAEILKKSNLSPVTLMNLIREHGVEPAWNEIALPNGRSVSSCQFAMSNLLARPAVHHSQQHQLQQQQYHPQMPQAPFQPPQAVQDARKSSKRPYSMGDATTPFTREIQPRPPFSTYSQQAAQSPVTMSPVEPPRKKRGRPTKAEYEKRSAEASARGEVWPKPRNKTKARRASEPGNEGNTRAGSMDESGGETGSLPIRSTGETNAATAIMSPRMAQSMPQHISPRTPRSNIKDMIQPAGQDDDLREGRNMRQEPPFYQQPLIPRITSQPRSSLMPPYSPQLGQQYHQSGYQSPAANQ